MRRRDIVAQNKLKKAHKDKERWASRGPEEIRRSQDLRNSARQRASQQSQINQNDASMYQPPPAPNITTSSSSSSSSSSSLSSTTAFVDNENEDDRSDTNSPIKKRKRFESLEKIDHRSHGLPNEWDEYDGYVFDQVFKFHLNFQFPFYYHTF